MSEIVKDNPETKFRFLNFIVRKPSVLNEQGDFKISVNFNPKGYILSTLNQFIWNSLFK